MARKIKLGDQYRDQISGFTGIATARYEFLNGCVRYELTGEYGNDPTKTEIPVFVFDEGQIEKVPKGKTTSTKRSETGGPQGHAPVSR